MLYLRIIVLMILVIAMCSSVLMADNGAKTVKLLTVGNSFSGNAIRYLKDIAAAAGDTLILQRADLPGCSMERHWNNVKKTESDPIDETGRAYSMNIDGVAGMYSLKDVLTHDKWEYVTMQQASILSPDIKTYRPYARNLYNYFKKHAPQAEVLMHQTWAYRVDDPGFGGEDGNTHARMYADLTKAYRAIARELGIRIMPVGDAMYDADTDPKWGYKSPKIDLSKLTPPTLPDQTHSLHAGWYWGKDEDGAPMLKMDGHHVGGMGCYLAGCVWYECMFKKSIVGNKYVPEGMSAADVKYLQAVAHKAVEKEVRRQKAL
ncbi:MAG: DUF4886 domain-containing protein [Armatimonadetes bacterium]|nr:DUF4886 domain-containing protein [Armatimonadota bacterium]